MRTGTGDGNRRSVMTDISIVELLSRFGLENAASDAVRSAMEEAGLTRRGKLRIVSSKVPAVERLIASTFIRVCHKQVCRAAAATAPALDGRRLLPVGVVNCEICHGSDNRRSVDLMTSAMVDAGRLRLLVVGGSPNTQKTLIELVAPPCEVRFVTNDMSQSTRDAGINLAWADVVVIWASTPIAHKTTKLYPSPKTITVGRRGVSALADGVTRHLRGIVTPDTLSVPT